MSAFKTVWSLLWSIPMCVAWIVMYAILNIGWGTKQGDKFIVYWNKMVSGEDDHKPLEIG